MSDIPITRPAADNLREVDPKRLERALWRLPFVEREAFMLKTRDRLSYAAIGTILGFSAEAAEARVVAALIKLDVCLSRAARPWWQFWR
ncbi:sigma factor-like helix-turn-helix DNA-binding protein [Novosphingobium sp. Gsoil 351]|uniref:sigma factor-like helix-turn-helix DNA-binding protein n=1 Tax=Novosphingobium sp. Gsoil 351 TaxID=2675225 RepID=UPI0012B44302|nr:sigma factor-like helix-turn-helix DNA-binding protein [Novosphingobium sp. Gsoil 351]QGN54085.1 hypothetical protein GKE62_05535 [Novosphingobium sp. Gsoil 351]